MHTLGEKQRAVIKDDSETDRLIIYVALNCKTLEGFAGIMRKYCSNRRGPIFSEVFRALIVSYDGNDDNTVGTATKKEKLMALLKNQVSTATSTQMIYDDMDQCDSLPSMDEELRSLRRFIDEKKVEQVGLQNRGRLVVYCRRTLMQDRQSSRKRNYRYFLKPFHENSF